ncbi:hypothetical protein P153DRAFT_432332 [Dothidotthia symphoricarpi CBS 119687]|uniref:Mid2 domain-containing protein n=1 Tax=Dothidotthia symphoricarpi CBS 119687 TaxID=1392245 RepID=A0A6A6AB10_9PLEO|nr:uncharacterized protein P153DRAFT_432332 [Dothidotthia symphoricarpi CBS 119687]KAF2127891.1 hypothetical protein P153DRAFT_432332 [Dothidotthia symphoricarpi CBS 119687]
MARSTLTWLRAAVVVAFATQVAAQTCYYPNGNVATGESACSSASGSACCPENWECMDNGSCYYPPTNLTGRYSCTDQSWNSPGCPSNLCTYNLGAAGGESLAQCSNHNNQWCCNGDADIVKCCQGIPEVRPFFALQDGRAYATIGTSTASSAPTLSTITGIAIAVATGDAVSTTPSSQVSSTASSQAASRSSAAVAGSGSSTTTATPFTSVQTSVTSGAGGVATAVITVLVTPSATADPSQSSSSGSKHSNTGLIAGLAVGIPLGLALVGIIFWACRKRRNQKKMSTYSDMDGNEAGLAGGAAKPLSKKETYRQSRPGTTEIDSMPVGPGQTTSAINGRAELGAGTGFRPGSGTPHGPDTVGIGGGNAPERSTWGSSPPGYSPGMAPGAFSHPGHAELDSTPVMPVINEKADGGQYRPPANHAIEMPTVVTPPEEVERRV